MMTDREYDRARERVGHAAGAIASVELPEMLQRVMAQLAELSGDEPHFPRLRAQLEREKELIEAAMHVWHLARRLAAEDAPEARV